MKTDGHNAYDREPMGYWDKQCSQESHILISVNISLQDGIFVENKPESLGALGINKEFL